ncbi:MAG TPA: XRE family transcriptional regulator [Roseiflexaceae bacterium]|nr:XRE family transcriptional regulator [Roseiflexaceae bacterium]
MISQQLRQLRLARGLSLEALARQMGDIVTRQALSKYEQGKAQPTPVVLQRLAAALGVKAADLYREPGFQIQFIAYRKRSRLSQRDQAQVQSLVAEAIQQRVRLQQTLGLGQAQDIPVQSLPVATPEQAERAAEDLRARWALGLDPIGHLTAVLEERHVHVVGLAAHDLFDGVAAVVRDADGGVLAATVVTRQGAPGERQRLSLAHELGHLVLEVDPALDAEKAAFRFGAAFLAPADTLRREAGERRAQIGEEELLLLKQRFGMSMQALLLRLRDLGVISEGYCRQWFIDLRQRGWATREPGELPAEQAEWLRRHVLRASAEGLIGAEEAARLLGRDTATPAAEGPPRGRAFLSLPLEERRRLLEAQAALLAQHYGQNPEREQWQGGDIVEQ